ncbi:hypothetical protein WMO40_23735 [Bacillaceae bacterium CLA-AA-H227]|uniref:Uncharacterized protein n=1 Tax=Robertmurraya yapensis (ex Hitch et al 2024) TaxID=3133160 RepID=A0ACC6SIH3_9BACI
MGIMGKINNFFVGIGAVAETIIDGTKNIEKKLSNALNIVQECVGTFDVYNVLDSLANHPWINDHENILAVKLVKASFKEGDLEIIDWYLGDLGLKPSHYSRQALWFNIEHWDAWENKEPDEINKYLRVAVYKEAERIKWDGVKRDKLEKKYKVVYGDVLFNFLENNRFKNPEVAILQEEERQIREKDKKIRLKLIIDLRESGSPREKEIIDLLLAGYTPAECLKALGEKWSLYQSIQRKLKTKLRKFHKKRLVI